MIRARWLARSDRHRRARRPAGDAPPALAHDPVACSRGAGELAVRSRSERGPVRDRGSAAIWSLAAGLVLILLAVAMTEVGSAITARHRAQVAADLGALAGAARAVEGAATACGWARQYVVANGGELRSCHLDGFDLIVTATVSVRLGVATASARAGPIP